eukprot:NODE_6_length_70510_cov_1.054395.p59 type:complete len:105 gc:universal NODE_6_length_70510_cov_1.054395:53900-54214(+)
MIQTVQSFPWWTYCFHEQMNKYFEKHVYNFRKSCPNLYLGLKSIFEQYLEESIRLYLHQLVAKYQSEHCLKFDITSIHLFPPVRAKIIETSYPEAIFAKHSSPI